MELLNIADITTHELNPNVMSEKDKGKLKELILKENNYPPLIINKRDNKYILMDGHQRLDVLMELGYKEAKCDIWEVDYDTELMLLATLNQLHGKIIGKKKALLYEEIKKLVPSEMIKKLSPENKKFLADVLEESIEARPQVELPDRIQLIQMLTRDEYKVVSDFIHINYDDMENSIFLMVEEITQLREEIHATE